MSCRWREGTGDLDHGIPKVLDGVPITLSKIYLVRVIGTISASLTHNPRLRQRLLSNRHIAALHVSSVEG